MRLILARHGQSLANVDPSYAGLDSPLTELGEQQADRLGQWLQKNEPEIDLIVCSPLRRARQTAEIANKYLNLPITVHEGLAEIARYDLPILQRRHHPFDPDTTHSPAEDDGYYEQYKAQVKTALDFVTADLLRPKPILVVSHGGTSATLLRLIFERHDVYFLTNNAAMHSLQWTDGRWRVHALNTAPHLPLEMIS